MIVRESRLQLTARAETTPMILGAPGSSLDLVMNSLYFTRARPATLLMKEVKTLEDTNLAQAIPLNTRFRAGSYPIVGTTLDYFEMRDLSLANGRLLAILGEAVVGYTVAEEMGLSPGKSILSSPEDLFNLAGQYPLKLKVVGILDRTGSPDDKAIFVDVKTSWIIEGIGHGHENLRTTDDSTVILNRDQDAIVANAKLRTYTEITPESLESFHFHGDPQQFALTGALILPNHHKDGTILLGRYSSDV